MSEFKLRLLRTTTDLLGDLDHVDTQTSPDPAELRTAPRVGDPGRGFADNRPCLVTVTAYFVDAGGAIITGESDRGSLSIAVVLVKSTLAGGTVYEDSSPITTVSGRRTDIGNVRAGDQYWPRVVGTSTGPAGSVKIALYVEEHPSS